MIPSLNRLWRILVEASSVLGLAVVLVTATPLVKWWAVQLAGPWTDPRGDVMIVLTGEVLSNGMVGESSYWRGAYTVMAWREGGWSQVILSGGGGGASTSVSEAMKIFLETGGIPAVAILVDSKSTSTRESAQNLAWMLPRISCRKILLTSDYHMFRAVRAFRKAGVTVIPRPVPDATKRAGSWNLRWGVFQDLTVETSKIAYYWARGWI